MESWDGKPVLENTTGCVINTRVERVGEVFRFTVGLEASITPDTVDPPKKDAYIAFA